MHFLDILAIQNQVQVVINIKNCEIEERNLICKELIEKTLQEYRNYNVIIVLFSVRNVDVLKLINRC